MRYLTVFVLIACGALSPTPSWAQNLEEYQERVGTIRGQVVDGETFFAEMAERGVGTSLERREGLY